MGSGLSALIFLPPASAGVTEEACLLLVIVELKVVKELAPVFEAQLLTYMRLTECRVGLLMNFNVPILKDGIKRLVL